MFEYIPQNICAKKIVFNIENGYLSDVQFTSGCHGNLQAIGKLVNGMNVQDVIDRLEGITCGHRSTSCPDQLAVALKKFI